MTSFPDPVTSTSTALVPYNPTLPHISLGSHLERVTDEAYRHSLELAKYAASHFPQVPPKIFTGRNFEHFSVSLNTPRCLTTDSSIDIEVFAAAPGDHKPPVLIFSHGYTTPPIKYRPLLGELASTQP